MKRAAFILIFAALMLLLPQPAAVEAEKDDQVDENPDMVPFLFLFEDVEIPALADPASMKVAFEPNGKGSERSNPSERAHNQEGRTYPGTHFTAGKPFNLRMDLHLDTSELGKSVQDYLNRILQAVKEYAELPPREKITVMWGDFMFKCRLESLTVKYTMFTEDGTPIRAVANCVFTEYTPVEEQLKSSPRH